MTIQDKLNLKRYIRDVFLFVCSWILMGLYFFYVGPVLLSQDITSSKRILSFILTLVYWPIVPAACAFYTLEFPYLISEIFRLLAERKIDETI